MQSWRDKLLKARVTTKEQKRQVEQEKRRERKQFKQGHAEEMAQAQQRQAYEAKLEAQRRANQQRAAEQRAQSEVREKRLQIRHIIAHWKVPEEPAGTHRWYFTTRENTITYLYVSEPIATQLSAGALAIVAYPEETETSYALVASEAADLIACIDPAYVRCYNAEGADKHDL